MSRLAITVLVTAVLVTGDARASTLLGVGLARIPTYIGASTKQLVPFALIQHESKHLLIDVSGLQARFGYFVVGDAFIGPVLNLNLGREGSDLGDDRYIDTQTVGAALEWGVVGGYKFRNFPASRDGELTLYLQVLNDYSRDREHRIYSADVEYFFRVFMLLRLRFDAGVVLYNDEYAETNWGIREPAQGAASLPGYEPNGNSGLFRTAANAIVSFSPNWGVLLRAQYSELLGSSRSSPVVSTVGNTSQLFLGTAVFYRF